MEKSLEDFLNLPDVDDITGDVFVSKRLGTFKVKAMTADEHAEYMKRSRGKVSKDDIQFDTAKFNLLIAAGQTITPNFADAELLKKANCATATEFIKKKLLAGEIAELSEQICKLSGFDTNLQEDTEEAKN